MPLRERFRRLVVAVSAAAALAGAAGCALTADDPDEKTVEAFNRQAPAHGYPQAESAECSEDATGLGDEFEGASFYDCRITFISGGSEVWCAVRHDRSDSYGVSGRGTCREAYERSKPPA